MNERLSKRIKKKMARLQKNRPLSPNVLKKLRDQFLLDMTYNSNSIEGNTMTPQETFMVLSEGITIKGKTLIEHLEIKNHSEAINYLYGLVDSNKKTKLTEKLIRDIHHLVVNGDKDSKPGTYRESEVRISGSNHMPIPGYKVPGDMRAMVDRFNLKKINKDNAIDLAAELHHGLVNIHPFVDGNGRTARLIMNIIIMSAGYPLVVILKEDRKKYYSLLEQGHFGSISGFVDFVYSAAERSLDIYLETIEKTTKNNHNVLLSDLAGDTTYSSEYLSLLARKGLLPAHKKNGDWYSSLDSVEGYRKNRFRDRK